MIIESLNEEDTYRIACDMGKKAVRGEVYTLVGDLGAGKTVFAGGFARGIGVRGSVASPTFTIVKEYYEGRMPFYHFDVYRISDEEELFDIGFEEYIYGEGVVLIEWGNLIRGALPRTYREISLSKDCTKGFEYRRIEICDC